MDLGISGKIAVVTGAGKGLGRAIAIRLAAEGARIAAVSRSPDPLDSLLEEIGSRGSGHLKIVADLTELGAAGNVLGVLAREVGRADIIVHNVGGSLGVTTSLATRADWERVWGLNLGVAIELNNALIPHMVERRWGRIVHVSTSATLTFQGYPAYVGSKAALNAYVRTVGRAVAKDNVVISGVMPGPMFDEGRYLGRLQLEDSEKWAEYVRNHLAIGRLARVEEIAPFVALFCSEHASFAAGSLVPVDGGSM